jgi:hypothetical protein
VIAFIGMTTGIGSLGFAMGGWSIDRLWFYLLGAAMSLILGVQLSVFWVVMRVLEELSERPTQIAADLQGKACQW